MLLTFLEQFTKYGTWPLAALIFCLIVVFGFRKSVGPIFDKIGPAIDRLKKAGPLELSSAPQGQQPVDVRTESAPKIFHPLESQLLQDREDAIRKDLEKLFPNDLAARANSLITHLAATQLVLAFESKYMGRIGQFRVQTLKAFVCSRTAARSKRTTTGFLAENIVHLGLTSGAIPTNRGDAHMSNGSARKSIFGTALKLLKLTAEE